MPDPHRLPARVAYEREVRAMAHEARDRLSQGEAADAVARDLVARRNTIKKRYRADDDVRTVALMEMRNRMKYGDPLGPDADWLLRKYGSWQAVIDAACRPGRLAPP